MQLTQILRGTWEFDGYITSDSGAIGDIYKSHHFVKTAEEAVEAARKAAAVRPKPRPRPTPSPAAGLPSMLAIKGGPAGAEVLVDGRVVGTLPVQVVVDAGRHDVSVRMEGYVQRRVYVEAADGTPLEVEIQLPALKGQ